MSGGTKLHTEDGSDKITFRLPTHLKRQYKAEVDNMSADLEEYVRRRVDQPADDGDDLEPFEEPVERELAVAYRTLCKKRSSSGKVRGKSAKKALAQAVDNLPRRCHASSEAPSESRICPLADRISTE